jgi:hypothetical protein
MIHVVVRFVMFLQQQVVSDTWLQTLTVFAEMWASGRLQKYILHAVFKITIPAVALRVV